PRGSRSRVPDPGSPIFRTERREGEGERSMASKRKPAPRPVAKKPEAAPAPEDLNPYQFAVRQFERAADLLKLDAGTRQVLSQPKRQLTVSIPVRMDNKKIKVFTGHRCQHSIARGPS